MEFWEEMVALQLPRTYFFSVKMNRHLVCTVTEITRDAVVCKTGSGAVFTEHSNIEVENTHT